MAALRDRARESRWYEGVCGRRKREERNEMKREEMVEMN